MNEIKRITQTFKDGLINANQAGFERYEAMVEQHLENLPCTECILFCETCVGHQNSDGWNFSPCDKRVSFHDSVCQ